MFLGRCSLVIGLAFPLSSMAMGCRGTPPPVTPLYDTEKKPNTTPLDPEIEAQIWRAEGEQIVDGTGEVIKLRGIAFGNEVWSHVPIPSAHHGRDDYAVVKSMGMNVVRFYLSYKTLEDDDRPFVYKDAGWDWIDQNVEWAKQHNIRLILNMHDPVGGYQSLGEGKGLWTDDDNQRRFIAMWRAIAERYRAEPTIAGLDILNEPIPTKSIEQWQELAEATISEIRHVNQHHIVFVERVNAVGGNWSENADMNFFKVSDPNVVYQFHFYKPFHFTHQNAAWVDFAAREAWYPEEATPEVDWYNLKTVAIAESQPLPIGSSGWTVLETQPFTVKDPNIVIGKPSLVCDNSGGSASFDALSLTRVDAPEFAQRNNQRSFELAEPETLFEIDLDSLRGWYFWKQDGVGQAYLDLNGHGDNTALSIANTTGPANLGSDPLRFFAKQGSEYTLRALAKAKDLKAGARCLIRLEFSSSQVPVRERDKTYLQQAVGEYLRWGKKHEVPLFLGEFGAIRDSFLPGRGGLNWVGDMLDILQANDVHFTYHAYHEMPFGLFLSDGDLPSRHALYIPLYDLFVSKLGGSGLPPWGKNEVYSAPAETGKDAEDAAQTGEDIETWE